MDPIPIANWQLQNGAREPPKARITRREISPLSTARPQRGDGQRRSESRTLARKRWRTATQAPPSLKAIVPEVAPPDPQGIGRLLHAQHRRSGAEHFHEWHVDGPVDTRKGATRKDVLVYSTPPLEEEVEVTGPIEARLFAATSKTLLED